MCSVVSCQLSESRIGCKLLVFNNIFLHNFQCGTDIALRDVEVLFVIGIQFKFNHFLNTILSYNYRYSQIDVFIPIFPFQISTCGKYPSLVTNNRLNYLAHRSPGGIPSTASQMPDNLFSTQLGSVNSVLNLVLVQKIPDGYTAD